MTETDHSIWTFFWSVLWTRCRISRARSLLLKFRGTSIPFPCQIFWDYSVELTDLKSFYWNWGLKVAPAICFGERHVLCICVALRKHLECYLPTDNVGVTTKKEKQFIIPDARKARLFWWLKGPQFKPYFNNGVSYQHNKTTKIKIYKSALLNPLEEIDQSTWLVYLTVRL